MHKRRQDQILGVSAGESRCFSAPPPPHTHTPPIKPVLSAGVFRKDLISVLLISENVCTYVCGAVWLAIFPM